jgi:hypothetical protein
MPDAPVSGRSPRTDTRGIQMGQGLVCAKCGGPTDGWRCAICRAVSDEHDVGHLHVGSDRYCTLRCAACQQADVHCTCV